MYYIKTTLLALFVSVATMAQKSITQQVYWIDNDIGAATAIATGTTLDVSAMAPGMHVLTMRVQDSDGLWSSPETRFFVVPHATTEPSEIVIILSVSFASSGLWVIRIMVFPDL